MKKLQRYFHITICFLLLTLIMATVSAQDETVTLVFRQNDPPNQIGDALENAIAEWNEANPTIQVELETVPWSDAQNQYVREVQAGGGPDVLQVAFVWTRDLASAGLVENLSPFIEADPVGEGLDDFLGVDLGIFEDSVYGIPWSVDTFAFGYRPDLLESAGVEYPQTWEELYDVASALTLDTDEDGRIDQFGFCFQAGSGSNSGMWFLANYYLWSNGEFFVEDSDDDGIFEVGASEEAVTSAMTYFNTFFEEGLTPQSMIAIDSWGDPEYTQSLGSGQCAIVFVPPAAFASVEEQSEVPVLSGPIPQGTEGRISHLGGRALVINPNSEHTEEAYQFLSFLTTADFYSEYYTNYFPPQVSLLENLEFSESKQGYAEQLPFAITFNEYIVSPAPVSAMWESTNREFGAVYSGQKTPEEAAADLIARMEELVAGE